MTDSFTWKGETYYYNPAVDGELFMNWDLLAGAIPAMIAGVILAPFELLFAAAFLGWGWVWEFIVDKMVGEIASFWYSMLVTIIYFMRNDFSFP